MGWRFMYWAIPGHYSLEGIITTQYYGSDKMVTFTNPLTGFTAHIPQWSYIEMIIGNQFSYDHRWINVGALVGFIMGLRVIFHLGLRFVRHETR